MKLYKTIFKGKSIFHTIGGNPTYTVPKNDKNNFFFQNSVWLKYKVKNYKSKNNYSEKDLNEFIQNINEKLVLNGVLQLLPILGWILMLLSKYYLKDKFTEENDFYGYSWTYG